MIFFRIFFFAIFSQFYMQMSSIYTWNAKKLPKSHSQQRKLLENEVEHGKSFHVYSSLVCMVKCIYFFGKVCVHETFSHDYCCFAISSDSIATCRHSGEILIYAMLYVCTVHILEISLFPFLTLPTSKLNAQIELMREREQQHLPSHYSLPLFLSPTISKTGACYSIFESEFKI